MVNVNPIDLLFNPLHTQWQCNSSRYIIKHRLKAYPYIFTYLRNQVKNSTFWFSSFHFFSHMAHLLNKLKLMLEYICSMFAHSFFNTNTPSQGYAGWHLCTNRALCHSTSLKSKYMHISWEKAEITLHCEYFSTQVFLALELLGQKLWI